MKKRYLLLPIKPEHLVNILNGKKTIEIRKYMLKCKLPIEVLCYCCKSPQTLLEVIDVGEEMCNGYRNDTGKKIFVRNDKYYFANVNCVDGKTRNVVLDLCGKIVAKFTLKNVDEYESEFCNDDCYESIKLVDRDEEDIAEYYITSNEEENPNNNRLCEESCLTFDEIKKYVGIGINKFYAWHIDDLVIFDDPISLVSPVCRFGNPKTGIAIIKAPQKYCYCEYDEDGFLPF